MLTQCAIEDSLAWGRVGGNSKQVEQPDKLLPIGIQMLRLLINSIDEIQDDSWSIEKRMEPFQFPMNKLIQIVSTVCV